MRKRIFAILMSAMMLITFMPSMAFAEIVYDSVKIQTPAKTLLYSNETLQLNAVVSGHGEGTLSQAVKWESSLAGIAEVSSSGLVTALPNVEGPVTIKAICQADETKFDTITITVKKRVELEEISLNQTSFALNVGEGKQITAFKNPSNATDEITWTSSNPTAASVSDSGYVRALAKADSVTITASYGPAESASVKAECTVQVKQPLESITLDKTSYVLTTDTGSKSVTLTASFNPSNANNTEVEWESSDKTKATVADGVVTAIAIGTAVITVTSKENPSIYATCTIEVKSKVDANSVELTPSELTVKVGETKSVKVDLNPSTAVDVITWTDNTSGKVKIVQTETGAEITGVSAGTGTITVKAVNSNKTANLNVTVPAQETPTGIEFASRTMSIGVGETSTISYVLTPSTAAASLLEWTSSAPDKVKVVDGVVTGVTSGTATVTATCPGGAKDECVVTITEKINLSKATVTLDKTSYTYTGSAIEPTVSSVVVGGTTVPSTSYDVTYTNNTKAAKSDAGSTAPTVTVTAKSTDEKYTGSVTKTFTIDQMDINDAAVTATIADKKHTGSAITLTASDITLKYNDKTLECGEGKDFTIDTASYKNNTNVADKTATNAPSVDLKGIGNFKGTKTVKFSIVSELKIEDCDITVANKVYTAEKVVPTVTVKDAAGNVVDPSNYTVTTTEATAKKIGPAKVTITGKGEYVGSVVKDFKIVPKKVSIKTPTVGAKKVTVKWTKVSYATGYQVKVCKYKEFDSGVKTYTVKKAKTVSKVVKSLKKGTKYYVKVRAYKNVWSDADEDYVKYYGAWSTVKRSAKVK